MSHPPLPRVTIALATRNGAAHLRAQLDSYAAQDHAGWDLWVSDDGSTDATRDILDAFAAEQGAGRTIRILDGPQAGVAANFMSLLCHPDLPEQPVALSDQDDVWRPEKLSLGLRDLGGDAPVLYGAQSNHVDVALRPIGRSLGGGVPSFGNALVQNIVSGHSAMLNRAALALVRRAGVPQGIPYHDWWLYQLITGAGGRVVVRPDAVLLYRQHDTNAMGSHQGPRAALTRARQVLGRTFGDWVAANTAALRETGVMTPASETVLSALETETTPLARLRAFRRHGITRQGRLGTAALHLSVALGRV
jgi:glycosyltransferase involved in cell wall biosynthesis